MSDAIALECRHRSWQEIALQLPSHFELVADPNSIDQLEGQQENEGHDGEEEPERGKIDSEFGAESQIQTQQTGQEKHHRAGEQDPSSRCELVGETQKDDSEAVPESMKAALRFRLVVAIAREDVESLRSVLIEQTTQILSPQTFGVLPNEALARVDKSLDRVDESLRSRHQ